MILGNYKRLMLPENELTLQNMYEEIIIGIVF